LVRSGARAGNGEPGRHYAQTAAQGDSVVEVVRVQLDEWKIEFKDLAEWFALEFSRMIVD
jgi:peptide methionine sulfoxide reductase MsrA